MEQASRVLEELQAYVRAQREFVVRSAGVATYDLKKDQSVVTAVDQEIERGAREIINKLQPDAGIYGEEYGIEGNEKSFWTIDPIDGTAYFIRGLPEYMFMAAYVHDDEPRLAIMYNFALDEMYITDVSGRAIKNGQTIQVSQREFGLNAYIETEAHVDFRGKIVDAFAVKGLYNLSIPYWRAGYGLARVSEGKIDARFHYLPYGRLYDFLPGAIMVRAAGGDVVNIGTDTWDYKNLNTIISNKALVKDIQSILKDIE
jgi:fructose-1,6-bisphosphatase/inositol monophosphatase family enzyme